MDSESCSAYDVSQANVALAVALAEKFVLNDEMKVSIMLPDSEEARRAAEDQGAEEPFPGVTINSLTLNAMENAQGGCFGLATRVVLCLHISLHKTHHLLSPKLVFV